VARTAPDFDSSQALACLDQFLERVSVPTFNAKHQSDVARRCLVLLYLPARLLVNAATVLAVVDNSIPAGWFGADLTLGEKSVIGSWSFHGSTLVAFQPAVVLPKSVIMV
jgi:hypothetical protein